MTDCCDKLNDKQMIVKLLKDKEMLLVCVKYWRDKYFDIKDEAKSL